MLNSKSNYYVYILKCSDNSLYTGVTTDLEQRLQVHRSGKGAKYVRARLPVQLIYSETAKNRAEAQSREYEIKSWTRQQKIKRLGLVV